MPLSDADHEPMRLAIRASHDAVAAGFHGKHRAFAVCNCSPRSQRSKSSARAAALPKRSWGCFSKQRRTMDSKSLSPIRSGAGACSVTCRRSVSIVSPSKSFLPASSS